MGGPDPVPRVAVPVVHVPLFEGAEERQVMAGHVDRSAPRRLDRHVGERREHPVQILGRDAHRAFVPRESRSDRARQPRLHASDAERDPAVGCGADVVERRPVVPQAHAVGPPDLLELLRGRRRERDVAAADGEQPPEPLPVGRPRVQRDDRHAGSDRATRRLGHRRRPRPEPRDGRLLVDPHPALEQRATDPTCEARGLHRRAHGGVDAAVQAGSVDQFADAVAIHHAEEIGHAQPLRRHHVVGPVPDLHLGAGGAEVPVRTEPGIDALLLTEPPDRRPRSPHPRGRARAPARPRIAGSARRARSTSC